MDDLLKIILGGALGVGALFLLKGNASGLLKKFLKMDRKEHEVEIDVKEAERKLNEALDGLDKPNKPVDDLDADEVEEYWKDKLQ